jgi:serine/threonine-protein kinase HipA
MVSQARRSRNRSLGVWMNGYRVGTWGLSPQGDTFAYATSWLDDPLSRPLSLSMPILPANEPYSGDVVRAWFDNLLPDSQQIRERLARRFSVGSAAPFDLLSEIGRDCVGAVQIVPESDEPCDVRRITGRALSDAEVAKALRDALTPDATIGIPEESDLRLSLAGAQEKTALLWHEDRWWLPTGPTPTTHILKMPLGLAGNMQYDLAHSVQNEWLCAKVLGAYDLKVANCEIATYEEHTVLVVERFDRRYASATRTTPAWWQRLPQEDLCQATGTPPLLKYESDGGPGMDEILNVLAGARDSIADRRRFLKAQILFWLMSAPDGHAKNFSISIEAGGSYSLTPLYDVVSASPYIGNGPRQISPNKLKLAMAVRGKNAHWRMNEIQRRHWSAVSRRAGLGDLAREVIAEIIEQTPAVIARIANEIPKGFPESVCNAILESLETKVAALAAQPAHKI